MSGQTYTGEFSDHQVEELEGESDIEIIKVEDGDFGLDVGTKHVEFRISPDGDPTVGELLGSLGSANHEGGLTPPQTQQLLAEIHPVVIATLVGRWAEARDDLGGSSAEHPDFRRRLKGVLDNYPDGYGGTDGD